MYFTEKVKREMIEGQPAGKPLCAGIVFCSELSGRERTVFIKSADPALANFVKRLLVSTYGVFVSVGETKRGFSVVFGTNSQTEAAVVPECFDDLPISDVKAFVRGVFLCRGGLSDPEKDYHLELNFGDRDSADTVLKLLSEIGTGFKIYERRNRFSVYTKNSADIEDFLLFTGANGSAFDFINGKIEKEIRNNENRATNCITKNISKAVSSARKQINDIEKLIADGRFSSLPEDLRYSANLRLANPNLSLEDLASLHSPPITKSGLSHRFKHISAEAEQKEGRGTGAESSKKGV